MLSGKKCNSRINVLSKRLLDTAAFNDNIYSYTFTFYHYHKLQSLLLRFYVIAVVEKKPLFYMSLTVSSWFIWIHLFHFLMPVLLQHLHSCSLCHSTQFCDAVSSGSSGFLPAFAFCFTRLHKKQICGVNNWQVLANFFLTWAVALCSSSEVTFALLNASDRWSRWRLWSSHKSLLHTLWATCRITLRSGKGFILTVKVIKGPLISSNVFALHNPQLWFLSSANQTLKILTQ